MNELSLLHILPPNGKSYMKLNVCLDIDKQASPNDKEAQSMMVDRKDSSVPDGK